MNLDELIKSVCETEANQVASPSSMVDLSKKTVGELWQDIQNKKDARASSDNNNLDRKNTREKQLTLGEMTLGDFLAKAGIVAKSSDEKKSPELGTESVVLPQQNMKLQLAQWMQYQMPAVQQQHLFTPGQRPAQQPVNEAASSETRMTVSSDTQTVGQKRVASDDWVEKTVARRQKRMIKNRESAARSRARKQAYTHELEKKVSHLEEENGILKREQEVEKALPYAPLPPEPKYQLRRTSSF
ncbi:hypothetical protein SSX86_022642 [Deinandra increscens subsp. villosa]|uniref:BZIP domain-containing protein n=1 Tax=Deinandra increscens subsp. villosa TaxID=3103831 RepID=A0AAP0CR47_9ASTR